MVEKAHALNLMFEFLGLLDTAYSALFLNI